MEVEVVLCHRRIMVPHPRHGCLLADTLTDRLTAEVMSERMKPPLGEKPVSGKVFLYQSERLGNEPFPPTEVSLIGLADVPADITGGLALRKPYSDLARVPDNLLIH
ncbi:hypothetical protein [Stratiformator vulcanicus]|uniref:hypothetical protein n=1 Tax=Stratiformator vulcanicus TaxID=2527980 RepID=UPI0028773F05|nr:hypothetical protein [Stratiformator vulcanicus]